MTEVERAEWRKDRTIKPSWGSEVMECIRAGKQTNTRAKVGQLHNVLD